LPLGDFSVRERPPGPTYSLLMSDWLDIFPRATRIDIVDFDVDFGFGVSNFKDSIHLL